MRKNRFDIAIVGGGCAGMTAAIYARRGGMKVALIEAAAFGGQILRAGKVENYPGVPLVGGTELAQAMESQVRLLGTELISARVREICKDDGDFRIVTDDEDNKLLLARAVILAAGVKKRTLGIPGEERFIGRGISWCATCDGNFFRGKTVAVVGGGNTAVQEVIHLSELCKSVYLVCRKDSLSAEAAARSKLERLTNVRVIPNTSVTEAIGETCLEAIRLENRTSGEVYQLAVNGLFEAIGMLPQNEAFASLTVFDSEGYLVAEENCRTPTPGVFAAGDCRRKTVRQLVSAASDGAVAALGAMEWLSEVN